MIVQFIAPATTDGIHARLDAIAFGYRLQRDNVDFQNHHGLFPPEDLGIFYCQVDAGAGDSLVDEKPSTCL